jgi:hypothetical protein
MAFSCGQRERAVAFETFERFSKCFDRRFISHAQGG